MRSVSTSMFSTIGKIGQRTLVISCLLSCLGFSSIALAQLPQVDKINTACAGTYNANLSCVSNDIEINDVAQMTEGEGGQPPILSCVEGEKVTLDIRLTTLLNANSRYDSLVWIGENGQNPRGTLGTCYVTSLPDDPDSPFILDLELDGDQCNDTNSSATDPVDQYMFQVEMDCIDQYSPDPNGDLDDVIEVPDGELDVFVLITWFQNNTSNCGIGEGFEMVPGVNPKCDAALLLGIDVEVLEAATIQVVKNSSGGEGAFDFVSDVPGLGNFMLDTTGDATDETAVIVLSDEQVGQTYSIAETVPAGWSLASATCSNGDSPDAVTPLDTQDVICTFNNVKLGSVTIVKETIGGPGSFDFTSNMPGGNFNIVANPDSGMYSELNVPAGVYNIAETVPAGWQLDSATCTDGSDPSALDVSEGETVTCTFINTKLGTVIVEKQTLPDGDPQQFEFTGDIVGTLGDGGQIVISNLLPATYTSTETVPAGWDLSAIVCDDGNSSGDTDTDTATFNLEAGEIVTCVFTNTKDGSIEVVKSLSDTGPAVETFGFTSNFNGAFNLIGDAATTGPVSVAPDNGYTVSEDDPTANGWANTGASCGDGSDPLTDIVVSPGEAVVCTFTNTPLGSAVVIKDTVGGNGIFGFTGDAPIGPFSLDTTDQFTATTGDLFDYILTAGIYDVTEDNIPAGWALTGIGCDDGSLTDLDTATASMDVELAETVTCTFTNTADGTLIIRKETIPDASAQAFTFTGDASGAIHDFSDTAEELSVSGQPGLYSSAEIVPSSWALTNISCTGQQASVITIGQGTPEFEPGDTSVEVDLVAGETVICTFENTAQGGITIEKFTQGGVGSFTFNRDFGASFPLDTTGQNPNSESFTDLLPGSYMISEVVPSNWTLSDIACSGATNSTVTIGGAGDFDPGDVGVTIDLVDGESILCTFVNDAHGSITVTKTTDPTSSAQSFDFTGDITASLMNGQSSTTVMVPAGNYAVTESPVAGWNLTSISCDDDDSAGVDNTANFVVASGEAVTCSFINTIQRGNIIVQKVTDPDTSTEDFGFVTSYGAPFLLMNGQQNDSGELLPTSEAGTYSVIEDDEAGWDKTSATCDDGSDPTAIDLAPGETVTCVFVNTIQRGNIIVQKVTDPDTSTEDFGFVTSYGDPFLLMNGQQNDSGELLPTSEAGTYSVVEDDEAGWDKTSAICDDGSDPTAIDLAPGETVTCVFVNTIQRGNIIVQKVTDPDDSTEDFGFVTSYGDPFLLMNGEQNDSGELLPTSEADTYSVIEDDEEGWQLVEATCTGVDNTPAAITLLPGETVTCTFFNEQILASITIVKELLGLPDDSYCFSYNGPDDNGEFCIETTNGTGQESMVDLPIGFYSFTEQVTGPYAVVSNDCSNGQTADALVVGPGDDVTCTFVNIPISRVPVNNPLALVMLILMMLATGWYFRPAGLRKF